MKKPVAPINNKNGTFSIVLTKGQMSLIDDKDIELSMYKWHITKEGRCMRHEGTVPNQIDIFMHRSVMERVMGRLLFPNERIDHIDGDPLNNRRSNLRLATLSQNAKNRKINKNNSVGLKGVTKHGNRWRAQIQSDGKKVSLGIFDTPELAHTAYCKAAKELHGEFARFE